MHELHRRSPSRRGDPHPGAPAPPQIRSHRHRRGRPRFRQPARRPHCFGLHSHSNRPRSFDLWGVDQTADLVREARELNENFRAVAVINGADAQGSDNAASQAALAEVAGITVAGCRIGRRKAYPNAAAAGLSVLEYSDAGNPAGLLKARQELTDLVNLLFNLTPATAPATPKRIPNGHRPQSN